MARFPAVSTATQRLTGSVFSRLAHRIAAIHGERYPLHVGDTWLEPPPGARMQDLTEAEHPGLHTYPPPTGLPALIARVAEQHGVSEDQVLITTGATGAWHAAATTLLDPGDEVLVPAPYWPLFPGIVKAARATPVAVPFFDESGFLPGGDRPAPLSPSEAVARVAAHVTDHTAVLYINSPSNPTGVVLSPAVLEALAAFARERGLWIWSDEVYALYAYEGEAVPIARFAPERTLSAYSFSKAHGLAGCRVGYLIVPPGLRPDVRKMAMHTVYSVSKPSQLAALAILDPAVGPPWVESARGAYQAVGNAVADLLGVQRPHGGTFVFVDVAAGLDADVLEREGEDAALHDFLVRCIDRGLVLAPGSASGPMYRHHVRLCFTSAAPEVVMRGARILAELIGR